jgi:integrase
MIENALRKENSEKINYRDLKMEITSKIYEKYEYCGRKSIYKWSISHILDYLFLNADFEVDDILYDNIRKYLEKKRGEYIGSAILYIKTFMKVCILYMHNSGIVELEYAEIEFIASNSTVLRDFYKRILNVTISQKEYKDIRRDMLLVIMLKNRIVEIEQLKNKTIQVYKEYLCSDLSKIVSHKSAIFNLENKLFLKGILEENAKFNIAPKESKKNYYSAIKSQNMKDAIIWYIENTKASKESIKKFRPHLFHFAKFIDENYAYISINYYNLVIAETYNRKLETDIVSGGIPSRNWACNCIIRINAFMNFLIDSQYIVQPKNRNIFMPNVFLNLDILSNRREAIPEYIVSRIRKNMLLLDREEQAILSVYIDTGIRLNELALISLSNIHENAKELISSTEEEIEVGIGWIKVVSPKILFNERIVLISNETYKLLMLLKEERDKKFGNILAQYNPRYPELGKRDFLMLNAYGVPYCNLDWKVRAILKKLNIKNDDGSDFELTAHKFRHTFLTDLVRSGVPIYVAMDLMGHVSPAMTQYYDHFEKDSQDIISENKIVNEQTRIKVKDVNNIIINGEQINKLHKINYRYLKRGGFCSKDEFQDACENIDCVECPSNMFKTNYSFFNELRKSMLLYLEKWASEAYEKSDKAIHFLYLAKLYEKLTEKVQAYTNEKEVTLSTEEMLNIAKEVGLE